MLAIFDVAYTMVDTGNTRRWWLLGALLGVAVLLRQLYLLFIPVLLLWMAWAGRKRLQARYLLLALGVVVLFVAPWTVRNYARYGQFLLLNSNSGYALYTSANPAQGSTWDESYTAPIPPDLAGANEAQLDRALTYRAVAFILADPLRYAKLTLSKVPYHFRFWPTPGSRAASEVVRFVSFGLYLPFMLTGLILSRRQWRRLVPIYLFAVAMIAIHVLSWPGPRYRFPVDAVFMVFVGLAISTVVDRLRRARQAPGRAAVQS